MPDLYDETLRAAKSQVGGDKFWIKVSCSSSSLKRWIYDFEWPWLSKGYTSGSGLQPLIPTACRRAKEFMRTNEAMAEEHRAGHLLVIPRPLEENSGGS